MKKLLTALSFLILSFSFTYSQSWLWGRQGVGPVKSDDFGSEVSTDKFGNAYLTGDYEYSISFGTFNLTDIRTNAFLVKYNASGNAQWAVQAGYSSNSYVYSYSTATDTAGNVYITGLFTDAVTFGPNTLTISNPGNCEVYLAKYDPNGNALWATQAIDLAASSSSKGYSVATDVRGNVYLTGWFGGPTKFGSTTLNAVYGNDVFIAKYDSKGNLKWVEQSYALSNNSEGVGNGIAADKYGNVYVTGYFKDTIVFGANLFEASAGTSMFLVKYDSNGNFLWANTPSGYTNGSAVVTDNEGNVFASGYFKDNVSFGSFNLSGICEMFLAKYKPNGNVTWAKQSKSSILETWYGISLADDANNDVYLGGWGSGGSFQFGAVTLNSANNPSFILKMDSSGNPYCGSIIQNGNSSLGRVGLAVDSTGNYVYMGGTFSNDTVVLGPNMLITTGGGNNPYLGRWQSCCVSNYSITQTPQGDSTVLTVSPKGTGYLWSNGATTNSITVNTSTTTSYSVSVLDTVGCPGHVSITIQEANCGNLFVPDAFSPNGDGQNDILYVRGSCIKTMDFVIYDRWGNKVFESRNQSVGWDGRYGGQPMNTGTYIYYLTGITTNGNTVDKKGAVELVR